jgi:hypothetical protein
LVAVIESAAVEGEGIPIEARGEVERVHGQELARFERFKRRRESSGSPASGPTY